LSLQAGAAACGRRLGGAVGRLLQRYQGRANPEGNRLGVEELRLESREDAFIGHCQRDQESIRARGGPARAMRPAAVEVGPRASAVRALLDGDPAAALGTGAESGQQLLRLGAAGRPSPQLAARPAQIVLPNPVETLVHGLPQLIGHDAKRVVLVAHPGGRLAWLLMLLPPLVALLRPSPDDHAMVEIPIQHLAHAGRRPAPRERDPLRLRRRR